MNLISMSLYGDKLMYLRGALANALLLPIYYPGWQLRFYCSEGMDTACLEQPGCQVVKMSPSHKHSGMFWRFLAAWDSNVKRVIFRDADSRFNPREAAAVQAWEKSGALAHCMHDHPHHASLPIFGGMWGVKVGTLPRRILHRMLKQSHVPQKRVADMRFLARHVLPCIQHSLLRHSSVNVPWPSVPLAKHPEFKGFVGQQYDDEGKPVCP